MIIPASRSAHWFSRLERAGIRVAISPQILAEVAEKMRTKKSLRKWLDSTDADIDYFLDRLDVIRFPIPGQCSLTGVVKADPKDDKIIAAAVEADADYIVSEDNHLLDLRHHAGIKIMNIDDFTRELDRLGVAR